MGAFEEYKHRFQNVRLTREAGVVTATLHTRGGPFFFEENSQDDLADAWLALADDPENRVLILTGTGDAFIGGSRLPETALSSSSAISKLAAGSRHLLCSFLEIGLPSIAAVNGGARMHAELAVMCDVVLMAQSAFFQDAMHVAVGLPPIDGEQAVWMEVLGTMRGKAFLLSGEPMSAESALAWGCANEILASRDLLPRARALAADWAKREAMTLRNSHEALAQSLRRRVHAELDLGLFAEKYAVLARTSRSQSAKSVPATMSPVGRQP